MRYKLLGCVFVLLISTPALSQEFSPIVVGTGKPVPSVVRSGEPFKITYRAEFFDTVLIYEEQMNFESLVLVEEKKPGPENIETVSVEVVGLKIEPKERKYNDSLGFVNVWDFTYTFRIINAQKGLYKIPSFNFIWVEKKAGVTVEETKNKEKLREMPTNEVGVGYISSIVKPPPLDIRDEITFISPITSGIMLRRWAYGLIGTALFLFMIVVFRFARKYRRPGEVGLETTEEIVDTDDVIVNTEPILSTKKARNKFLKELEKLRVENKPDFVKSLRFLVRNLLLAELRGTIRSSMSENEIYTKLSGLDDKHKKLIGSKYGVMMDLTRRLKSYQEYTDSGEYPRNDLKGIIQIVALREAVSSLKFRKRVLSFVRRLGDGEEMTWS